MYIVWHSTHREDAVLVGMMISLLTLPHGSEVIFQVQEEDYERV